MRWNHLNDARVKLVLKRISPSWLSVEKATIRLKSFSIIAAHPPQAKVRLPRISAICEDNGIQDSLSHKIIPAVTKVEECTSLEIGVGAAIAAGSQDIAGNCALLVIIVRVRHNRILGNIFSALILVNSMNLVALSRVISPTRFVNIVIIEPSCAVQEE